MSITNAEKQAIITAIDALGLNTPTAEVVSLLKTSTDPVNGQRVSATVEVDNANLKVFKVTTVTYVAVANRNGRTLIGEYVP